MRSGALGAILVAQLIAIAPAIADPLPTPPETPRVRIASSYPRSLIQRRLLLPPGVAEASIRFALTRLGGTELSTVADPNLRVRLGPVELRGGGSLLMYETRGPDPRADTIAGLSFGAHFAVRPDLSLGLELSMRSPATYPTIASRAVILHKARLGERAALELLAGVGEIHRDEPPRMEREPTRANTLSVGGQLKLQVQLTPEVAIEGRAALTFYKPLDEVGKKVMPPPSYFGSEYGLRMLGSLSQALDVFAGLDVYPTDPDPDIVTITVGLAVRVLP